MLSATVDSFSRLNASDSIASELLQLDRSIQGRSGPGFPVKAPQEVKNTQAKENKVTQNGRGGTH